jgi:hypothetical protein
LIRRNARASVVEAKHGAIGPCFDGKVNFAALWNSNGLVLDVYEAKRWPGAFAQAFPTFARWRTENYERCATARRIVIGRDAAQGIGRVFPFSRLPPDNKP